MKFALLHRELSTRPLSSSLTHSTIMATQALGAHLSGPTQRQFSPYAVSNHPLISKLFVISFNYCHTSTLHTYTTRGTQTL